MLSVGIWGATGFMGAPFSRALLQAHRANKLRFIILHRPESNLARYPPDIEKRCLDLQNDATSTTAEKLQDLQVVVSCSSWRAGDAQYRLIDALKGSKELVTFFPSEYATPHREEDLKSGMLAHSEEKVKVVRYCEEQGVPYTRLFNGTVPSLLFWLPAFSAFKAVENKLHLYWPLGNGTRGLTSEEFSGQALVHLLLNRLSDLPSKSFSLVEISFSARDLVAVFTKLHDGEEPTIIKYTEEEYQRDLSKDFMGAMGAAGKKGLAVGAEWPGEVVSDFPGWETKTLEDYVRPVLTGKPLTIDEVRESSDLSKA